MKWKHYILASFVILVIIMGIIYSLPDKHIVSSNDIFTEEVYDKLVQIEYWNSGTRLIISKDADIRSFTSKVICLNDEIYYTDSTRDLVQLITSIAGEKQ